MPTISLRTVYQTLNDLAAMGELVQLELGTGSARFDPNLDAHHHLVCDRCGKVLDVDVDASDRAGAVGRSPGLQHRVHRDRLPRRVRRLRSTRALHPIQPDPIHSNQQRSHHMPELNGSKTQENLKEAFAGESQANRRYLYFAQKADIEGYPDVAALFRSVAEGETGHAFGHFDFLAEVGDPVTGVPVGPTEDNLKSAIAGETYEYTEMYPGLLQDRPRRGLRRDRRVARDPGPRREEPRRPLHRGPRVHQLIDRRLSPAQLVL